MSEYSIVIPTIGRPSLRVLLESLAQSEGPFPHRVVVVDDRTDESDLDVSGVPWTVCQRMTIVRSGGRGPAAARNCGWRVTATPWVVFVDDDVLLTPSWCADLASDLAQAPQTTGGIQGCIEVPLPSERAPTDWERNVRGLMDSVWITADMAYRRSALEVTNGFDERFRRAYREDADLAIRVRRAGFDLTFGTRRALHPVRPADPWISVRLQRGNADDVIMRALHGARWRDLAGSPRGRFAMHALTVAAAGLALGAALRKRPRLATVAGLAWAGLTGEFAWRRIAPGPRTPAEVATMAATSTAIPFAAVYHKLRGVAFLPSLLRGEAA